MHPHLESMTLPELADRLEDLDGRRTPVGWTPDDAVERSRVERCILERVVSDAPDQGVPCALEVQLRSRQRVLDTIAREIGSGGVWVEADDRWLVGAGVEMVIHTHACDEHGLRVRGVVAAREPGLVRIAIADHRSEGHERRIRRFVFELIRHRIAN